MISAPCSPLKRLAFTLVAAALAYGSTLAYAQNAVSTGSLTGTVHDPSGGLVTHATVTVVNEATGEHVTSTSNDAGIFSFPALKIGTYDVSVSSSGFKTSKTDGVVVGVGHTTDAATTLAIGQSSDTVTVTSDAASALNPHRHDRGNSRSTRHDRRPPAQRPPLHRPRSVDAERRRGTASSVTSASPASRVAISPAITTPPAAHRTRTVLHRSRSTASTPPATTTATTAASPASRTSSACSPSRSSRSRPTSTTRATAAPARASSTPSPSLVQTPFTATPSTTTATPATGANDAIDKGAGNAKPVNVLQQFGADHRRTDQEGQDVLLLRLRAAAPQGSALRRKFRPGFNDEDQLRRPLRAPRCPRRTATTPRPPQSRRTTPRRTRPTRSICRVSRTRSTSSTPTWVRAPAAATTSSSSPSSTGRSATRPT